MTLDRLLSDSVAPRRFSTFLLSLFAGLALLLASVGVYAVMSYAVGLRRHEIGIRVALGAKPGDIGRLITGGGARLVFAGIAIGMAGAFALTKLLSGLLYGVTATDPITFVGVALFLACVVLLACYIPARQAMRIDPNGRPSQRLKDSLWVRFVGLTRARRPPSQYGMLGLPWFPNST